MQEQNAPFSGYISKTKFGQLVDAVGIGLFHGLELRVSGMKTE